MNAYRLFTLIVVSVLVAILLASALNNFSRVSDSALAEIGPTATPRGNAPTKITPAKRDYLPIILLNPTIGTSWLLNGNSGTSPATDFLGTTDNVTLTIRVNNTVAYRIVPVPSSNDAPNLIGGYSGNRVTPGVFGATIGGGGANGAVNIISGTYYATIGGGVFNTASNNNTTVGGGYQNTASGYASTIGGGYQNVITPTGDSATIGGGSGNTAGNPSSVIGGGFNNIASNNAATVGGGQSNSASNQYATVGGGFLNSARGYLATIGGGVQNTASGIGAFVGGGGYDGSTYNGNKAQADASAISGGWGNVISSTAGYGFIGGGLSNTLGGLGATVIGGGQANTANGGSAFIGGGYGNNASANYAVIGGGNSNTASGDSSTVGGGYANTATGTYATVPGGVNNVASGDDSFAAGQNANTNNKLGAFVWADSTFGVLNATTDNQFLVRASGGITLYSGAAVGVAVYPGSGSWNTVSNKNLKTNFATVDSRAILAQVTALPITTWNYKTQDASIRHIGPMAQDFSAAFKVGENDTTISTVDAQGVALAAIQGLAQENQELKAQNASLEARVTALEQSLDGSARHLRDETQSPISNSFTFDNLPLWGVVGLLALWLMRRPKER